MSESLQQSCELNAHFAQVINKWEDDGRKGVQLAFNDSLASMKGQLFRDLSLVSSGNIVASLASSCPGGNASHRDRPTSSCGLSLAERVARISIETKRQASAAARKPATAPESESHPLISSSKHRPASTSSSVATSSAGISSRGSDAASCSDNGGGVKPGAKQRVSKVDSMRRLVLGTEEQQAAKQLFQEERKILVGASMRYPASNAATTTPVRPPASSRTVGTLK